MSAADPLADEIAALEAAEGLASSPARPSEVKDALAAGCSALRHLARGYGRGPVLDFLASLRVAFAEPVDSPAEVVGHEVVRSYAADVVLARAAKADEATRLEVVQIVVAISAALVRRYRVGWCRDDIVQDHVLLVLSKIDLYAGRSSLRTWISRVCENHLRNFVTRRKPGDGFPIEGIPTDGRSGSGDLRHDPPDPGDRTPWDDVIERWRHERLYRALGQLPQEQWEAVVLRFFGDLSYEGIADRLGIPVGTVKSRVARGVGRLALELRKEGMNPRHD